MVVTWFRLCFKNDVKGEMEAKRAFIINIQFSTLNKVQVDVNIMGWLSVNTSVTHNFAFTRMIYSRNQ